MVGMVGMVGYAILALSFVSEPDCCRSCGFGCSETPCCDCADDRPDCGCPSCDTSLCKVWHCQLEQGPAVVINGSTYVDLDVENETDTKAEDLSDADKKHLLVAELEHLSDADTDAEADAEADKLAPPPDAPCCAMCGMDCPGGDCCYCYQDNSSKYCPKYPSCAECSPCARCGRTTPWIRDMYNGRYHS